MDSLDQPPTWPTRVAQKRQERAGKIPLEWRISDEFKATYRMPFSEQTNDLIRTQAIRKSGILTERELEITEDYTVQSLLAALADGTFTSVEVTVAYSKRAAVAQQLVSCLTETMFEEAQERAKYLDNLRSRGQLAGPLHGLPISIKDNFHYKGTESTIGMVAFLDEVSEKHSPLVDILLKLGAVLYVKTNVPQTMMTCESHNNIFQRTLNPWNTSLGPGGSSGGEGALIALRGSPLGVGTDIGGSVRIPALCCGTYGFRPSAARIPNGEMRTCNTPGLKFILSCAGPLSLDLDGIELFFRSVLGAQPALYDSTIIDIAWRQVPGKSILRIGVIPEDPLFPLHPPVKRALAEATSILEAQGHQVIRLDARDAKVSEIAEVAWNIFSLDPSAGNHLKASRDPPVPGLVHILKESERLKAFYTPTLPDMNELDRLGKLGVLNARRAQLREEYRKLWVRHELDVCIAPPAQSTAVPHDLFGMPPYTVLLNLLDYPSCIIPFGCVDEADSKETFEIREDQVAAPFNYEQLKGAPRSIQVFTTTMRDEECLQIAKQIDQCLKGTE